MGPNRNHLVLDPQAELLFNNRLSICCVFPMEIDGTLCLYVNVLIKGSYWLTFFFLCQKYLKGQNFEKNSGIFLEFKNTSFLFGQC